MTSPYMFWRNGAVVIYFTLIRLEHNEFITVHQEQVCFLAQLVRATVSITSDVRLGTRDVDTYDLPGLGRTPTKHKERSEGITVA